VITKSFFKKILIVFLLISSVLGGFSYPHVLAKTSSEIGKEIENQQKELNKTQQELKEAEEALAKSLGDLESVQSGLPKIEAEISKIEAEIKFNMSKLKVIEEEKRLKELEKADKEQKQKASLRSSYMEWRSKNPLVHTIVESQYDLNKNQAYTSRILSGEHSDILGLLTTLDSITLKMEEYEKSMKDLEVKNQELAQKKRDLETQIAYYNSIYANNSVQVNSLKTLTQNIESQLNGLREEQKQAYQKETWILEQNKPPTPQEPPSNGDPTPQSTFVFSGRGRDLYQGHGVGMSQWGAYGAANAGMDSISILKFYYAGVGIIGGYESRTINVEGYGTKNIEDYVAGQGEVPGRACGTAEMASARPDKYVVDNPGTAWDCWPEEAIKAQAIAFRTYGLFHAGFVYSDARSQVYNGSNYTRWAADETRGKVITAGGNIIEALYSSDNSQGAGTANNDTIWQNIYGDGTPYSYLRAANDSSFAYQTPWTYWQYQTVGRYNYTSIGQMLNFVINQSPDYDAGLKSQITAIKNAAGTITSVEFERDPSGRVKKVWLSGSNGRSSIGGWWFKNLWNNWAYYSETYDYIYSQTFYLNF
jgi:peptidoglycan hydrolase-like amidase